MAWLRGNFPGSFGNIQHSERFLKAFLPSLVSNVHTCIASSLHSILPATGLPSLITRIIDVVSTDGRSLLPTIYSIQIANASLHGHYRERLAWNIGPGKMMQQPLALTKSSSASTGRLP